MLHLPKIFKLGLIASVVFLTLTVGIYIYYPRIIYKGIRSTAVIVFHLIGKDQPYNNKYGIHPYLLQKIEQVIDEAKSKGIDLRVVRGYRSLEEQQRLYDQGRITEGGIVTYAPPGLSYHNYGWAVDVCEYKGGKPDWHSQRWDEIGEIGKEHGLIWGGDWKRLVDKPHLQLSFHDILNHGVF